MKPVPTSPTVPAFASRRARAGFTLVEIAGVIAVTVILAAVVSESALKRARLLAARLEGCTLANYATALQNSIPRNRYIPGATNWAKAIADELGVPVGDVVSNSSRFPRLLLIDPQLQVGVNNSSLPYRQTASGSTVTNTGGFVIPPVQPRLLILSSLAAPLPDALTNGIASASDFNSIWDAAPGSLPATATWAGWNGAPGELVIQRINLQPLFVRLLLCSYGSSSPGRYSIDRSNNLPVPAAGLNGFFLEGTALELLTAATNVDSEQILMQDTGLSYVQDVWRSGISSGPPSALATNLTGMVMAQTLKMFAASPGNPNATSNVTPASVVTAVSNYLSAYNIWATAGFPASGASNLAVKTAGTQMQTAMRNLAGNFVTGKCQ